MDTEHTHDLSDQGIHQFRIERGADVRGSDGVLGTVEQLVVDRESGQPRSLVLRGNDGSNFELPYNLITAADSEGVDVSIGKTDLERVSRPYTPDLYVPVDEGVAVSPRLVAVGDTDEPVITQIESDAVEISAPTQDASSRSERAETAAAAALEDGPTVIMGQTSGTTPDESQALGADISQPDVIVLEGVSEAKLLATSESALAATDDMTSPMLGRGFPPDGDHVTPSGESSLANMLATGILLGTAAAGITYLIVRQRQRRPALAHRGARGRLAVLRGTTASSLDNVRAAAAGQVPAVRTQMRQATASVARWLPVAGAAIGGLRAAIANRSATLRPTLADAWDGVGERTSDLRSQVRMRANRASDALSDALPARGAVASALASSAQTLAASGKQLGKQLTESTAGMQRAAKRQVATATDRTASRVAIAQTRAAQTRRAAALGARRVGRRMRWFRRGMVAGAVWGILYAPEPGLETRTRVAKVLSRIPGLDTLVGRPTASRSRLASTSTRGAHVGATGPRPRDPSLAGERLVGESGPHTPSVESVSEEPMRVPPMPDTAPDEISRITGV